MKKLNALKIYKAYIYWIVSNENDVCVWIIKLNVLIELKEFKKIKQVDFEEEE